MRVMQITLPNEVSDTEMHDLFNNVETAILESVYLRNLGDVTLTVGSLYTSL